MRKNIHRQALLSLVVLLTSSMAWAGTMLQPVSDRYASADVQEAPNFQKHVSPLLGRLGCNGRACHGSFQGRGGFRLSLFGYDFKADHDALLENERVNTETPLESLIIAKPTDEDEHEGGLRYERGSWQYHVLRRWIEDGAKFEKEQVKKLTRLEVIPSEIVFKKKDQQIQLKAVAHWEDGVMEDVTPLCRFQTNSGQVAKIDENGLVTSNKPGDTHVVVFYDNAVEPIPVMQPVSDLVGKKYPKVATPTKVDELVVEKLKKLGIVQSDVSNDAEFLRRVSLDITGTLPTPQQIESFLADESKDKRKKKIDELLESPAYAAWWTTKLCDFTGNNDNETRNFLPQYNRDMPNASQVWYDWIYKRVANNTSYADLCEGIVLAASRKEGQTYTEYCEDMCKVMRGEDDKTLADDDQMVLYWARRQFRDAEPRAINFAYAFMGIRIQCAQCHKHPFDQWSKEDFAEFTNFFRQVTAGNNGRPPNRDEMDEYNKILKDLKIDPKLRGGQARREYARLMMEGKTIPFNEVYVGTAPRRSRGDDAAQTEMTHAKLLGGDAFEIKRGEDIRKPLMKWLRDPENPFFAKAFVNRVWASYFHRGIVEPPDDNSLANPPCNKPLLDYLTKGFIDSGFDMKWIHREIANSSTYQLSWMPNETNAGDEVNFSRAVPRRLPAELVYDALTQATGSNDKMFAMHHDMNGRAIAIPGSSARYLGGRGNNSAGYALTVFGKSTRENNCDCDRATEPSLLQTVFLQNDNQIHQMIAGTREGWVRQLAQELKLSLNNRTSTKPPANYEQTVTRQRQYIKQLKKKGNKEQARKVQARLDQMIKRFGDPEQQVAKDDQPASKVDEAALVRQAYLRTLSRYPDQRELNRSVEYLAQYDNTLDGVQGLLWALLNTKEFIVNH